MQLDSYHTASHPRQRYDYHQKWYHNPQYRQQNTTNQHRRLGNVYNRIVSFHIMVSLLAPVPALADDCKSNQRLMKIGYAKRHRQHKDAGNG